LNDCIESGWISSQGGFVNKFQQDFAAFNKQKYGVATSNCTTALHLALAAIKVGPGDEIICSALTFIAPANMIHLTGAKLILVDSDEPSWNMDPEKLREKITEKTKAIIVVHSFGHAARMDEIMSLANEFGLYVIEDVAEAPGAYYKDQMLGSIGHMSCYSFFGNKIMTTGEGGMVLTGDEVLKDKLEVLRDHGMSKQRPYVHTDLGFNYRMTNMQAAIGIAQLEALPSILEKRMQQREEYQNLLSVPSLLGLRPCLDWCSPVHWLMTVTLQDETQRDRALEFLKNSGIDCRQMIYPVYHAHHFRDDFERKDFPITEKISLKSLHLPSSTDLTSEQIQMISETLLDWLKRDG